MGLNISLRKKIYNNKEATDSLKGEFSDIIKSKPKINTKKFFEGYKNHFYKIPKEGQLSHTTLINQSQEYLDDYKDIHEDKILQLNDEIERLNELLSNKQSYIQEEHFFYPDKTLLKYENNANLLPVWVMQKAAKREIKSEAILRTIIKAFGHKHDTPLEAIVQKVDIGTLTDITEGPLIATDSDLNKFKFVTSDITYTLRDLVDYTVSEVTCIEGKQDDLYDLYKPINSDGWQINGLSHGEGKNRPRKAYLEGGGCEIRKFGIELNEAGEIYSSTERIYPGETKKIWYRNDPTDPTRIMISVKGFIREVIEVNGTLKLTEEEYRKDELGRIFSNLSPGTQGLISVGGSTRVKFWDVPQQHDQY